MKHLQFQNLDKIPAIGLGTWKAAKGEVYKVVREAIKIGYRHFDCAHIYNNEAEIGQAFADAITNSEIKRADIFITSKLWNNFHHDVDIEPAFNQTLENLKLEYLDLYLIHWPVALQRNINFPSKGEDLISLKDLPLHKTWEKFILLKQSGKVRHIGVSNFSKSKINDLITKTGITPEMNQVEMHPFLQQKELLEFCSANNILVTAYAPLGSADRPENRKLENEPRLFENEIIMNIAEKYNISAAKVMLSWAVCRGTIVIPKSVNSQRLAENLSASEIVLNDSEMTEINNLDQHYRFIKGDFWCFDGADYTVENLWDE